MYSQYPGQQQATPALPPGWVAQWSEQYGCYYYAHTASGHTQWTVPEHHHAPPPFAGNSGGGYAPPGGPPQHFPPQHFPPPLQQQQQHQHHQQQQPQFGYEQQLQREFAPAMPQQYAQAPGGRKKAVLVGINYTGTEHALAGCINDALNLQKFLIQRYAFPAQNTLVLTDDARDPTRVPTGRNIMAALSWLMHDAQPGDSLFFSYSGHGSQTADIDGSRGYNDMDDTICPVDFKSAGQITSTQLHHALVGTLPPNAKLTVFMDCCHSGTMLELPYTYRPDGDGKMNPIDLVKKGMSIAMDAKKLIDGKFGKNSIEAAKGIFNDAKNLIGQLSGNSSEIDSDGYKQENFNNPQYNGPKYVYCISGCKDEQTSADTAINGMASGALTYAVLHTLQKGSQITFEQLLDSLRMWMKEGNYKQVPQLSCGVKVDPSTNFSL